MFVYTSFGFDLQLVMTIIPKGLPIDKTAGMKYHFLSNSYGLCTVCALYDQQHDTTDKWVTDKEEKCMLNQFSRTELLFGKAAMEKLASSRVAVFGIGGVGGYV